MGKEGVEPSRPSGHTDLNRARLPFRHFPVAYSVVWVSAVSCDSNLPGPSAWTRIDRARSEGRAGYHEARLHRVKCDGRVASGDRQCADGSALDGYHHVLDRTRRTSEHETARESVQRSPGGPGLYEQGSDAVPAQ